MRDEQFTRRGVSGKLSGLARGAVTAAVCLLLHRRFERRFMDDDISMSGQRKRRRAGGRVAKNHQRFTRLWR
ncbi:hypothetical protein D3C86_2169820 [compost metagenome]